MIATGAPLWLRPALLVGLLLWLPHVGAGSLHLQGTSWESARVDHNGGASVPREQFQLGYERPLGEWQSAFRYRYEPIRLRVGEPASNSHLHQFRVDTRYDDRYWRVEAGLGAQGSSNRFAYHRYHEDMLVPNGALLRGDQTRSAPRVGVAADHRFGPFRLYPRVRWEGRQGDTRWVLDVPVEASVERPRWSLGVHRVGDKWSVLDSDREVRTQVYRYEWQLRGWLHVWQHPRRGSALSLGAGSSFSTRLRYTDLDAGRRTADLGQSAFLALRLTY